VRKLSLPVRLALLVAGTTLPLIVFATAIVFHNYEQDREAASLQVLQTVRSIRYVLDAEMQRMTGGLEVLALTTSLREGDFGNFRRIALGFLDQYGKDGVVLTAKAASYSPRSHPTLRACRCATTAKWWRRSLPPSVHNIQICSSA
jgi:hypothetical protein